MHYAKHITCKFREIVSQSALLPSPEVVAVSKAHLILNLCMTIGNEKCACLMNSVLKPFYVRMKPSNHIPVFLMLNHCISSCIS